MDYVPLEQVKSAKGLRLVLVQGLPSPWGVAAKTIFEMKGVPFICAPQSPGAPNEDLVAWSGQGSGPVVAWDDEKPVHHWLDILFLAERIAPNPRLVSADAADRALMIGLSHEICGEGGIGWSRREMMFAPAIQSGQAPEPIMIMAQRYHFDANSAAQAAERCAGSLRLLTDRLKAQKARGSDYFIGDAVTALDVYWAAFSVLAAPPPDDICPIPAGYRPGFETVGPVVQAALDPLLLAHRDMMFDKYFRIPMDY
jgi:glutathione S-transferase